MCAERLELSVEWGRQSSMGNMEVVPSLKGENWEIDVKKVMIRRGKRMWLTTH